MAERFETSGLFVDNRERASAYPGARNVSGIADENAGVMPVAVLETDEETTEGATKQGLFGASESSEPGNHRVLTRHELVRLHAELLDLTEQDETEAAVDRLADAAGISRLRSAGLVTALRAHPDLDLPELLARETRPHATPSDVLMEEITLLMDVGKKLEAIAHYSERMNVDLKEAQTFIEALDEVTDFECEVAQQVPTGPLLVALGAGVLLALSVTLAFFLIG
jgi:ribosomal protein L7/L12